MYKAFGVNLLKLISNACELLKHEFKWRYENVRGWTVDVTKA